MKGASAMNRLSRILVSGAAAAGAAIGGFTIASALASSSGHVDGGPIVVERPDMPWLLPDDPADNGMAPAIFSDSLSAIANGRTATITRGTTTLTLRATTEHGAAQACVDLFIDGERSGWQCSYVQDVATGRAVGAFLDGDTVRVIGIAPDDATTVVIGGREIKVESNLWFFSAPKGTDLSFRVSNSDGTVSTSVGGT